MRRASWRRHRLPDLVPCGPSQLQPSVRDSFPTLGARAYAPESTHMQLRYLVVSRSLALPLSAFAQAATHLYGLVVTGTRTALTADQSRAAVEVIDQAQILRSQARSLQDLLRGRAGIDLANQGGQGKVSTLFMRGTESDHVLFLIDGVRVGSATSGLT